MREILFIGHGNMALSIAKALKDDYAISVAGRDVSRVANFEKALGCRVQKLKLESLDISGKIVLLCIKPFAVDEVSQKLKGKATALYSVLAGTTLESLRVIDSDAYIRAMPNLAAELNSSMTTLCGDQKLQSEAEELFGYIGKTLFVRSQKELDVATALAGSGPAYLSLIAEALTDGAVKQGIRREDAMLLTRGLFTGFADLLQQSHPALIKDRVMSPAGTTAAGYSALERAGVRSGCIDAIEDAYRVTQQKGSK